IFSSLFIGLTLPYPRSILKAQKSRFLGRKLAQILGLFFAFFGGQKRAIFRSILGVKNSRNSRNRAKTTFSIPVARQVKIILHPVQVCIMQFDRPIVKIYFEHVVFVVFSLTRHLLSKTLH